MSANRLYRTGILVPCAVAVRTDRPRGIRQLVPLISSGGVSTHSPIPNNTWERRVGETSGAERRGSEAVEREAHERERSGRERRRRGESRESATATEGKLAPAPWPQAFGSFGGFECMIAELSRLSASHAQHDR